MYFATTTLADWAGLGAAVFTALAATAALWTAWQGRQLIEASERPRVEAQVLADPGTRMLRLALVNTGTGLARGVNFMVHALGQVTHNVVNDGFMQPGERVHALTGIGPLTAPQGVLRHDVDDLAVMVAYRDAAGFVHYRTHAGVEYVPRTLFRRPKFPDRAAVWERLYPALPIDSSEVVANALERP